MMVQAETEQSSQKNRCFSLVLVGIDFFKPLHTLWGLQVANYIHDKIAGLIKRNLQEGESIAFYKGEHFLILLPEAGVQKALRVADMIRRAVEKEKWPNGISVTVSTGVASYPEDGERLTELLKSLESALSRTRSRVRNPVIFQKKGSL